MRNEYIVGIIFCVLSAMRSSALPFTINGVIGNIQESLYVSIVYQSMQNGHYIAVREDSVLVKNGKFCCDGEIKDITAATLEYENKRYRFYIEPGDVQLYIDSQKPYELLFSGGSVENEYREIRHFLRESDSLLYTTFDNYQDEPYKLINGEDMFSLYLSVCRKRKELLLDFCKSHPQYEIVPDLLCQFLELDTKVDINDILKVENFIDKSCEPIVESSLWQLLKYKINNMRLSIRLRNDPLGCKAPDFFAVTESQDTIRLSDFYGKSTVILFFNPFNQLGNLYHEISEIIDGVMDEDRFEVIEIMLEFKMIKQKQNNWNSTYPKVTIKDRWNSDLYQIQGWELCSLFAIGELPYMLMIDKSGKVIMNKRL